MDSLTPYIMVKRNDATNLLRDRIELQAAERYIHQKRKDGHTGFGIMHLIIASYVRTVSQRPGINRFVSGQKIYARNRICVNMEVKRTMELDGKSTILKVVFDPADTAVDVYRKFNDAYERSLAETETDFDSTARIINSIPGLVKKLTVWLLNLMDYFDLVPRSLLDVSPFHASMFITSMGSLGIPPVFHHLYNFGNVPIFISFGAKYHEYLMKADGTVARRNYIDVTVDTDERICDGFYFASALRLLHSYLKDPSVLDAPPETVAEDIE